MKFRDDLAWVMAMDELQGDIPDPSSALPDDDDKPTSHAVAHGLLIQASSGAPAALPSSAPRRRPKTGSLRKS